MQIRGILLVNSTPLICTVKTWEVEMEQKLVRHRGQDDF